MPLTSLGYTVVSLEMCINYILNGLVHAYRYLVFLLI
jgi:hypothetical protein